MRTFEVVYDSYQGFGSHVEQARGKRALSLWYIQLSFYNFFYVSICIFDMKFAEEIWKFYTIL